MGCFSYICKECNKPILSNSVRGERVKLFMLKDGKIVEEMEGEYDSYGRVFDNNMNSIKWEMGWSAVCDLLFNNNNGDGISVIHSRCFVDKPTTISRDDPNQGWGDNSELMGNINKDINFNKS